MIAAILTGIADELTSKGRLLRGHVGLVVNEEEQTIWMEDEAYDDISGARLNPAKVVAARAEEIEYGKSLKVYEKRPIAEC